MKTPKTLLVALASIAVVAAVVGAVPMTTNALGRFLPGYKISTSAISDNGTAVTVRNSPSGNTVHVTITEATGDIAADGASTAASYVASGAVQGATVTSTGGAHVVGALTEDNSIIQTPNTNAFWFQTGTNTSTNVDASGNGAVRINSNSGGLSGTGTGGLEVWAGANASNARIVLSPGLPSVDHGTIDPQSSDFAGAVTGIGANTTVVLTYSAVAFFTSSWCQVTPTSKSVAIEQIIPTCVGVSCSFSCFSIASGLAANCDDFAYHCDGRR